MPKVGQSGRFLGKLLGSLLKTRFPLMKNIPELLAKRFLIESATDAAFQKKVFGSGITKLLIYIYIYVYYIYGIYIEYIYSIYSIYIYVYCIDVGQYILFMWPSSFVFLYWFASRKASCAQFLDYVSIYVLKILTYDSILFM